MRGLLNTLFMSALYFTGLPFNEPLNRRGAALVADDEEPTALLTAQLPRRVLNKATIQELAHTFPGEEASCFEDYARKHYPAIFGVPPQILEFDRRLLEKKSCTIDPHQPTLRAMLVQLAIFHDTNYLADPNHHTGSTLSAISRSYYEVLRYLQRHTKHTILVDEGLTNDANLVKDPFFVDFKKTKLPVLVRHFPTKKLPDDYALLSEEQKSYLASLSRNDLLALIHHFTDGQINAVYRSRPSREWGKAFDDALRTVEAGDFMYRRQEEVMMDCAYSALQKAGSPSALNRVVLITGGSHNYRQYYSPLFENFKRIDCSPSLPANVEAFFKKLKGECPHFLSTPKDERNSYTWKF